MNELNLSDILVSETPTQQPESRLKKGLKDFLQEAGPQNEWSLKLLRPGQEEGAKPGKLQTDLTATAANLDASNLQKLQDAEVIRGSTQEFQHLLVALAIKGGTVASALQTIAPHLGADDKQFDKDRYNKDWRAQQPPEVLEAVDNLEKTKAAVIAAGTNVANRLVESRKETIGVNSSLAQDVRNNIYIVDSDLHRFADLGDFKKGGPFNGASSFKYAYSGDSHPQEIPAPLQQVLFDYQRSHRGLPLSGANDFLKGFQDTAVKKADSYAAAAFQETVKTVKADLARQEQARITAQVPVRDQILGPDLAKLLVKPNPVSLETGTYYKSRDTDPQYR